MQPAEQHLRQSCPIMARLISQHGPCTLAESDPNLFQTLVNSIISQQLSTKAAGTIKCRVREIVPNFMPAEFLTVSTEALRKAGLSSAKTRYIVELAQRVSDGRLNLETIKEAPDKAVIDTLVALPGIGQWTAEMFLIFGLRRQNVLSLGDAGLQRATRLLFGNDAKLAQVSQPWRPFRSVASWYLWRHLDI